MGEPRESNIKIQGLTSLRFYAREILTIVILGSLVMVMFFDPIKQNLAYHDFADKRAVFNIPNFFNVVTSTLFAVFGVIGLGLCLTRKQNEAPLSWITFFVGVTIVCFGSGYYHWNPNSTTLVWDRLPMTIGFMGLFIGILSEYVNPKIERYFLVPAILVGLSTVIYWHYMDDLRLYLWVQFVPLLVIPIVMILFGCKYTHQRYLIFALIAYLLAKFPEAYDKEIFSFAYEQFSGHSLKHLLVSMGIFFIYFMLNKRKLEQNVM